MFTEPGQIEKPCELCQAVHSFNHEMSMTSGDGATEALKVWFKIFPCVCIEISTSMYFINKLCAHLNCALSYEIVEYYSVLLNHCITIIRHAA